MNANLHNKPVYISQGECVTPLGFNLKENIDAIHAQKSGIQAYQDDYFVKDATFLGAKIDEAKIDQHFNALSYAGNFTKLEKMMLLAVDKIKSEYGNYFGEDCGLIISSTKGNIEVLKQNDITRYNLHELGKKIANTIGIKAPAIVLSNACVSGIMAIAVAKQLIAIGKYKSFVIIGGDVFSKFVFSGFQSFQAVSDQPCKPYDKARNGITLGEAAAAVFVTSEKEVLQEPIFKITGESSINDANHISGPSRTGEGLFQSTRNALMAAGVEPKEIDFISAHGTATMYNDEMEAQAFNRIELEKTPLFSLKGYYGHTLGAAGLLETVISLDLARQNTIPVSLGYHESGLTLPLAVTAEEQAKEVNLFLKTASGFGGSNTAVVFRKLKNEDK